MKAKQMHRSSFLQKGEAMPFILLLRKLSWFCKKTYKTKRIASWVLKIQFVGANADPIVKGLEEQECKSNYFIGNEKEKWHTNIANFAQISYESLYPGIDAVFYGNKNQLEYDLCLSPGVNPRDASLRFEGAKELLIDESGNLRILMGDHEEVQMQKPFVYQVIEGKKVSIEAHFTLLATHDVGFILGSYDQALQLIIDPSWSIRPIWRQCL